MTITEGESTTLTVNENLILTDIIIGNNEGTL